MHTCNTPTQHKHTEAVALGMARCASYHPSQPHAPVYVCLLFHLVVCGDTLPLSLQQLLCEEVIGLMCVCVWVEVF